MRPRAPISVNTRRSACSPRRAARRAARCDRARAPRRASRAGGTIASKNSMRPRRDRRLATAGRATPRDRRSMMAVLDRLQELGWIERSSAFWQAAADERRATTRREARSATRTAQHQYVQDKCPRSAAAPRGASTGELDASKCGLGYRIPEAAQARARTGRRPDANRGGAAQLHRKSPARRSPLWPRESARDTTPASAPGRLRRTARRSGLPLR